MLNNIPILAGIINTVLIVASTLGALGFLGLGSDIGISITDFMHKTFFPYYFVTKIAHVVSFTAIIALIILLFRGNLGIWKFIIGLTVNILWMLYYWLLMQY